MGERAVPETYAGIFTNGWPRSALWPEEQLASSERPEHRDAVRKAERTDARRACPTGLQKLPGLLRPLSGGYPSLATRGARTSASHPELGAASRRKPLCRGLHGENGAAGWSLSKATLRLVAGGPSLNSRVAVLSGHPGHPFWKEGATLPTPVFSQEDSDQIPGATGEGRGRHQLPAEGGQGHTSRQQAGWGLAGSGASCSNGSQIPHSCVKKCVHGVGSQAGP